MLSSQPFLIQNESPGLFISLCLKGNCFPQEIFLEPHLIENFVCPIDFGVCRDPVIDSCGHTFGKICLSNCLRNNNKCPLTNKAYAFIRKYTTNFGVKNFLDTLKIKCLNYNKNCNWEGKLDELEKHLANDCVDIQEDCPIEGCNEKIARGELLEHIENSCKFVKMKCLFEKQGCQEMLNSKEFPLHLVNKHYEEIRECVKKFDFLNQEKEIYEKKYHDLLLAFFMVDSQRNKIIKELKDENMLLKNKLLKTINNKVVDKRSKIPNQQGILQSLNEKKVNTLKISLDSSKQNEYFENILDTPTKKNGKRVMTNKKPMPLRKKTKIEEFCMKSKIDEKH